MLAGELQSKYLVVSLSPQDGQVLLSGPEGGYLPLVVGDRFPEGELVIKQVLADRLVLTDEDSQALSWLMKAPVQSIKAMNTKEQHVEKAQTVKADVDLFTRLEICWETLKIHYKKWWSES
jgi:hypothetical protein